MIDWKTVAEARGLGIPAEAVAEMTPTLNALDEAFQPLLRDLSEECDPAFVLSEASVSGE